MGIQKQDLRIGNWIFDAGDEQKNFQIEQICKDSDGFSGYYVVFRDGSFKSLVTSDLIEPIPITPEILEKCGFEWSIYHQAFHKHEDGHEVYDLNECYPKGYQFSTFKKGHLVGRPIFYLHQLQNFVHAITGEELEVKL